MIISFFILIESIRFQQFIKNVIMINRYNWIKLRSSSMGDSLTMLHRSYQNRKYIRFYCAPKPHQSHFFQIENIPWKIWLEIGKKESLKNPWKSQESLTLLLSILKRILQESIRIRNTPGESLKVSRILNDPTFNF